MELSPLDLKGIDFDAEPNIYEFSWCLQNNDVKGDGVLHRNSDLLR